jgi:hypothetical protein
MPQASSQEFISYHQLTKTLRAVVRFEAFMVIECSEVFSGDQLCENGVVIQRFGDCLCHHHQAILTRLMA